MPNKTSQAGRLNLRFDPAEKALLVRAAALRNQDATNFIRSTALVEASAIVREAEEISLSARDTAAVLELLENPPAPPERLNRAAKAGRRL